MATSGTISTTVFRTQEVIDSAYRGCRLPAQAVTAEMITIARQQLYLILSALANQGVPLWCQTKHLIPMYQGVYTVPMPVGTIDVLNANIRTLQRIQGTPDATSGDAENAFDGDLDTADVQVAVGGQITLALESATEVTTVGINWGATGEATFELQYSDDGATWTTFYSSEEEYAAVDREWLWLDFQGLLNHSYWRLQNSADAGLTTPLNIRELFFGNTPSEINLSRLNKDDFFYLPNKVQQSRPTQFWLDRQRDLAYMNLNPAPNSAAAFWQIVALVHRHIMDVGTMRQELEVPQRWYDAVVWQLAKKLCMITPEVKTDIIPSVKAEANETLRIAWAEERDNSPVYIQTNISPYTR